LRRAYGDYNRYGPFSIENYYATEERRVVNCALPDPSKSLSYRAYRQQWEAIRTALRRATEIMASGDLEGIVKPGIEEKLGGMKRERKVLLDCW
jgi:hypothetical protein